jgi:hypothetical protein
MPYGFFPSFAKEISLQRALRQKIFVKSNKNHYDKRAKNLLLMLFHEKIDKKSYKLDIYKIASGVYNIIPDKNTDPRRLLIPAQPAGFWRNINLMISLRT